MVYRPVLFLFACCLLPLFGIAQEVESEQTDLLYETVIFPDRSLIRRLEQADRLFEIGRSTEAAQLLGNILETADFAFLPPDFPSLTFETRDSDDNKKNEPIRTLRQTLNDHIIDRIRKLPKEARASYVFQFEPTAKRLLENAIAAGSLDEIQQVARKYFPTTSGASAAFIVGLTQFERGDYSAALLTLDRLKRLHPSLPEPLSLVLEQTLEKLQTKLQHIADPSLFKISESAWLEQAGWQLPAGSSSQTFSTKATAPLLEQNWTVPLFTRLSLERETDAIVRMIKNGNDVYIPASQPLVVDDLFLTRTFGEIIAVDTKTGKRLWIAQEPGYRFPDNVPVPLSYTIGYADGYTRRTLLFFFWFNRIAHQLSSDGEKLFSIDGYDLQKIDFKPFNHSAPNFTGKIEDLRNSPGNTLSARDLKTGRILWQAGKFPYVQKYIDIFYAAGVPQTGQQLTQQDIDDSIFTDDEKTFKETWFLGAPLPLHGRLYVIGETEGILRLFVLESQTGRLVAQQVFAQMPFSILANFVRRIYPLFPSASDGIVICPTGNGLVAALDATTLSPIWCFSYAAAQTNTPTNRMMRNQQRMLPSPNINTDNIRQLRTESGWQVPSILIDRQRVLVAPPDQGTIYCLDLLSGELLWEQTISRLNTLYVACIQNDKVFLVTPVNLMVFDMNTGEDITPSEERFPSNLKPAGVGVHSGNQYFIPFSDGYLAVADLNSGKLTLLNNSGSPITPPVEQKIAFNVSELDGSSEWQSELQEQEQYEELLKQNGYDADIFAPALMANDVFQRPIQFGNLVGIKGQFFSQSPTQIASFDQKESLKQQTETLLNADPNDPEGLLKQGRILKSEGKFAEAINCFRFSLKAKPTAEAADFLRKNLLELIRKDYTSWSYACQELESLAESPDEWAAILYAQTEGILQSGQTEGLNSVLEKVFAFGDQAILLPVGGDHSTHIHRALGGLINHNIMEGRYPVPKAQWEELAETFFRQLMVTTDGFTPATLGMSPRLSSGLPPNIQHLSMFVHIFRNTVVAQKAKQVLREEYERNRLPVALDLLEKSAVSEQTKSASPFIWKSGTVKVRDVSTSYDFQTQQSLNKNDIDQIVARLVTIAKNPNSSRSIGSRQQTVPFLGLSTFELSTFTYVSTPAHFLCCNDLSGREQWRLALPITELHEYSRLASDNSGLSTYIKGLGNFLLFVHEHSMIAIDVSQQPEVTPKILWSQTLSSPLVCRQQNNENRLSELAQRPVDGQLPFNRVSFPKNSVFISPHVVCYWDANCVYGLDPLTGQMLWIRNTPHEKCSIMGDAENLFLIFPDVRHVIAVDPASGRELASGLIPTGVLYTFGTNIVVAKSYGADHALFLCDLRDLYDKRRRALLVAESQDGCLTPPIPMEILNDKINSTSLIQMLRNERYLSVATWSTKSLQIYDLLTKEKLLPEENKMLQFVPKGKTGTMRCDIEFVDNHFLVLFIKDMRFQNVPTEEVVENGRTLLRTYNTVVGVSSTVVGEGVMMLFDSDGNPCWSEPTEIKNWTRLLDVSDRLPVMLFAVSVADKNKKVSTSKQEYSTQIMGLDKRSGERRFRNRISLQPPLHSFWVSIDPQAQEITFITPNSLPPRVVKAIFTDDPVEETESEKR